MIPRVSARPRLALSVLALSVLALLALVFASAGCIFDPDEDPPIRITGIPDADTPQNALIRFEKVYELQRLPDYEAMFASNFRFTFSSQSDPGLASLYGDSWGKDDEVESTSHLFTGFTNDAGEFQQAAAAIELAFTGASFVDDPSRPDSGAYYKYVIVPAVNLRIGLAGGEEFQISAPHDFYLVRGDAAVLDASQPARADRWYVHRWDDRSAPLAAATRLASFGATPVHTTWGALRSAYVGLPK